MFLFKINNNNIIKSNNLETGDMAGMFLVLAVQSVWCMARLHRKLYKIGFLSTAIDGHLAADEKCPQFTYRVPRGEVVARVIAGDEHSTLDATLTTATANHDGRLCGRIVRFHDGQASCTMCLTTYRALLYHQRTANTQIISRRFSLFMCYINNITESTSIVY